MLEDPRNLHWRQTDFATSCLIRGMRAEMDLPTLTPANLIAAGFAKRSGLFFANPYLVDWCLALAIKDDQTLSGLKRQLLDEVIASANDDGSFGRFDPALSTGLAILCMHALGHSGRHLRLAQIRLLNFLDAGPWPVSTPFYSTFISQAKDKHVAQPGAQRLECAGQMHELSLYRDGFRMVFAGVVASALAIEGDGDDADESVRKSDVHPRYRCLSVDDYIMKFALPPYLESKTGACLG
jgi:hypothetical protein